MNAVKVHLYFKKTFEIIQISVNEFKYAEYYIWGEIVYQIKQAQDILYLNFYSVS